MRSSPSTGSWMGLMVIGLAVVCFSGHLQVVSADVTEKEVRLAAILSGTHTNDEQLQYEMDNGQPPRPRYQFIYTQISADPDKKLEFYHELFKDGELQCRHFIVLAEDDEEVVYYQLYEVPPSIPESPTPEALALLANAPNRTRIQEGNEPTTYEIEPGKFFGKRPDCQDPSEFFYYSNVVTCNTMAYLSDFDPDSETDVPFIMKADPRIPLMPMQGGKYSQAMKICKKQKNC